MRKAEQFIGSVIFAISLSGCSLPATNSGHCATPDIVTKDEHYRMCASLYEGTRQIDIQRLAEAKAKNDQAVIRRLEERIAHSQRLQRQYETLAKAYDNNPWERSVDQVVTKIRRQLTK